MVTAGETVTLPSAARPVPTLLIETLLAPVVVHVREEEPPTVIRAGVEEKLSTLGTFGGGLEPGAGPIPEMPSHVPPWLDWMLIMPELSGLMDESRCRSDQLPRLSTFAAPSTGEPVTVGPTYNVIVLPGPGIELVPAIRHSFLSARNSRLVIVIVSDDTD